MNANDLPALEINTPDAEFERVWKVPQNALSTASTSVELSLNRTTKIPPDPRDLGVVITTIELR